MSKTLSISKEEQFEQRLSDIYPNIFTEIVSCHSYNYPKSFRINTLKSSSEKVIKSLAYQGFGIKVGDLENSYICLNDSDSQRLSDTVESKSMQIYIQELSSMIPALILDLKPGNSVLDLCASPGSKTSQIADILQNKGEIVANEQSRDRWFKLKQILLEYGSDAKTLNENGKILPYKYLNYVQYFDRILIDAPCSNEASLRFDQPETFKFWRSSNSSGLSKLQKGLLSAGITMLNNGGTLVYSTCTYSVEENESVVNWALSKHKDIDLVEFSSDLPISNLLPGITKYKNKEFDERLSKTVRILPNEYFKGFYIAKFSKLKV